MREIRELEPHEIPEEAKLLPGGFAVGVLEDGEVVALLGVYPMLFLDPLWINPSRRGKLSVIRALWAEVKKRLFDAGVRFVVGHADASQPRMARLLARIGVEVTGKRQFVIPTGDN